MTRPGEPGSFETFEQLQLTLALGRGEPLVCPRCAAPLALQEVRPADVVPYVRHRVWVTCPSCRRTAVLDRPPAVPDGEGPSS